MDTINDPNNYNMIEGGNNSIIELSTGFVTVRLKSDPNKIVRIKKEDYHKNKDLYLNIGLTINDSGEIISLRTKRKINSKKYKKKYIMRIKESDNDNFYNVYLDFVNRYTLEIKRFHYKNSPKSPYDVWYPYYFFSKTMNFFITKEVLDKLLEGNPNREKLSKKLGISTKSFKEIISYYENLYNIKYTNSYVESKSKRFSGKRYIHLYNEEKIIDSSELDKYLSNGWKIGKAPNINLIKEDVINYYCEGHNLYECEQHFKTSRNKFIDLLGIDSNSELRTYNKDGIIKRLKVNSIIEEKLFNNGWTRGKP